MAKPQDVCPAALKQRVQAARTLMVRRFFAASMGDVAVETWLEGQDERMQTLIRMARQRIQQAVPGIVEQYKAGAPFYGLHHDVFYLEPKGDQLVVAFVHDVAVPDPDGLTSRDPEYGQHILIRNPSEMDGEAIRMLLQRAAALAMQGH